MFPGLSTGEHNTAPDAEPSLFSGHIEGLDQPLASSQNTECCIQPEHSVAVAGKLWLFGQLEELVEFLVNEGQGQIGEGHPVNYILVCDIQVCR